MRRRRSRLWVIARHEWRATVLRREFLMMTIGIPLLMLLIVLGTTVISTLTVAKAARRGGGNRPVAILDQTGLLAPAAYVSEIDGTRYQLISSVTQGQEGVASGQYRALLMVPPDYLTSGRTMLFRKQSGQVFDDSNNTYQYDNALRAGLMGAQLPRALAERVIHPQPSKGPTIYEYNSAAGRFQPAAPGGFVHEISKFAVPYAFSMLLLMSIFTGTGYLLYGLVEEKENRLMEVLLSSASHEEILRGKLIGLGAAGLTQIGVWALLGAIPATVALSLAPGAIHIPALTAVTAIVLFGLGFALYGTIMAGMGSLGTSWRESQQATAAITMCAVIPLMLMPVFLAEPNGTVARVLSWLPPTAPIAMMLRVGMGSVAWWDMGIGFATLVIGIWLTQKMSAKLFRLGLLMYGKAPTMPEVWRWMVRA